MIPISGKILILLKQTELVWKCFMMEFSAEQKLSRGIEIGSLVTCISTRISGLQDYSRDIINSLVLGQITQEDYPRSEGFKSPQCLALRVILPHS